MALWEQIKAAYPELTDNDFINEIILRNDSDGFGDYIEEWKYKKPIPEGLTVGKPSA